jgi:preprotein translocase subunit SecA
MKVKRAFSLDAEIVEFLDSQKNASKFLNHIVRQYILMTTTNIDEGKKHSMDLAWGELYINLEDKLCREKINFPKQNYTISDELVKTVHAIMKRLKIKVTEDDCRNYLIQKMIL